MNIKTQIPPHSWPRLIWCALLAVVLHVLLLWLFGPRPGASYASSIVRPILFTTVSAEPVAIASSRTGRPKTRAPAPPPDHSLSPPPVQIPAPEPVTEPTPPPPAAEPSNPDQADPVEAVTATSLPLPAGPQVVIPGSQRLKYSIYGEMRRMAYHASGELLWAHDGQEYDARMEVGAFLLGTRVQQSKGRVTPEGLQPQRFSDQSRRERMVELDHAQAEARFSEGTPAAPLLNGAQDQLSVFMQLASQLAANPQRYPRGTELTLQIVGIKSADTWHFVVNGEETLNLPGGEQATLKFTRLKKDSADLGVEIWLAPALGWLPARIRLTQESGDYIDQQWRGSEAP
jgi:hypothetical protein